MKYWIIILCITPALVFAQDKEEKLLNLSKRKFDWMIHKQFDSLRWVLDERVQYVHSNGWIQTKQEILDDIQSGKLVYQAIDIQSAFVRFYDKTAIVNGRGKFQVVMGESSLVIDLSYTEVYTKNKGRWLLSSRHANRMP
jgi:hypothetical protein